ncbi:MAG: shikimate kinase, partial [Pseudomonas sp.]
MAVALVGLPGAGKSAVGRRLGMRLDTPFIDTDHVIEQRIG